MLSITSVRLTGTWLYWSGVGWRLQPLLRIVEDVGDVGMTRLWIEEDVGDVGMTRVEREGGAGAGAGAREAGGGGGVEGDASFMMRRRRLVGSGTMGQGGGLGPRLRTLRAESESPLDDVSMLETRSVSELVSPSW